MQLTRQFNNTIQLITQLSLKLLQIQVSHQSLTVTQLIQGTWYQTTEVNVTNPTKTFTTQLSSKLKINLQTTVWGGWSVLTMECNYQVRLGLAN